MGELSVDWVFNPPDDEQATIAGGNTARVYGFDVAKPAVPAATVPGPALWPFPE
jgi:hypothetical protein